MNIFLLILMCHFVNVKGIESHHDPEKSQSNDIFTFRRHNHQSLPLPHVKIRIMNEGNSIRSVNLKQTERALANQHLPIWTLNGPIDTDDLGDVEVGLELKRNTRVMNELGKFTIYQDREASAAAVYFHERREFDGIINYDMLINGLPIELIHRTDGAELELDYFAIYRRPGYEGHKNFVKPQNIDPDAGVNYQKNMKTYGGRVYEGFPEILVVVSWDVAEALTAMIKTSDHYIKIVSHVITLFNAVDMLYSKLEHTNIQINIAGIIIGTEMESFLFLQNCNYKTKHRDKYSTRQMMDANCANVHLRQYLKGRKHIIPASSYDTVIFLTKRTLFAHDGDFFNDEIQQYKHVIGEARTVPGLYQARREDVDFILIATLKYDINHKYYPAVAHELAHLMTVEHDESPAFTDSGDCCGNILKSSGSYWCEKCISWSETSEVTFNLFFSSPNCCTFINKPRSLLPPKRRKMMTANDQCQCYGYPFARKYQEVFKRFCESRLQCQENDNTFQDSIIPMDGTPCGDGKVCANRKCLKI